MRRARILFDVDHVTPTDTAARERHSQRRFAVSPGNVIVDCGWMGARIAEHTIDRGLDADFVVNVKLGSSHRCIQATRQ